MDTLKTGKPLRPTTIEECWELIDTLVTAIQKQEAIIQKLEERLNSNSNNSSKPPSSNLIHTQWVYILVVSLVIRKVFIFTMPTPLVSVEHSYLQLLKS